MKYTLAAIALSIWAAGCIAPAQAEGNKLNPEHAVSTNRSGTAASHPGTAAQPDRPGSKTHIAGGGKRKTIPG
jgi:hypothetical protein